MDNDMNRTKIRRGPGKQRIKGKDFILADEVDHIRRQAGAHVDCLVTVGQLLFFSTETGDAWLLDPSDQLATQLASDGEPEPIFIEETDSNFTIGWRGHYQIEGGVFVYVDQASGRIVTIDGYPVTEIVQLGQIERQRHGLKPFS
jgi:hypothetical protein